MSTHVGCSISCFQKILSFQTFFNFTAASVNYMCGGPKISPNFIIVQACVKLNFDVISEVVSMDTDNAIGCSAHKELYEFEEIQALIDERVVYVPVESHYQNFFSRRCLVYINGVTQWRNKNYAIKCQ